MPRFLFVRSACRPQTTCSGTNRGVLAAFVSVDRGKVMTKKNRAEAVLVDYAALKPETLLVVFPKRQIPRQCLPR